jgi:phage terminase large subunit-like protein
MTTTLPPTSRQVPEPTPWPDFVGHWPRLTGRQEPEFESRHPGDEAQGDRCAKFGVRIGLRCLPWEWQVVRAVLSLQPPDRYGDRVWTHRDVCIECTRQQGKTLIVVLLIVFHLFVLRTKRIVYTAQRWSTAADVFDRVVTVINRVPSLRKRLAKNPSKRDNHGVIELRNGAKAEFAPRSQDFGRGYTEVDLLIHDEAYDLDARETANLEGAQRAARNPQTITVSTPPVFEEHPKCHRLASLHRLGHARAPHLYYALFAAPKDASRDNPKVYRLAQPSYGVVGNDREMASTRQKAKTFAELAIFDADYLGRGSYPPPESEHNSSIPAQMWTDMEAKEGPLRLRGAPIRARG